MTDTTAAELNPAAAPPPIVPAEPMTLLAQGSSLLSTGSALALTAAATMTPAALEPLFDWVLNGCPRPVPAAVSLTIAALAIIATHATQKLVSRYLGT